MEQDQKKRNDGPVSIVMRPGVTVEMSRDAARSLLTAMETGELWGFINTLMDRANENNVNCLEDQSMTQDHVEEVFRTQGERAFISQLMGIPLAIEEALTPKPPDVAE